MKLNNLDKKLLRCASKFSKYAPKRRHSQEREKLTTSTTNQVWRDVHADRFQVFSYCGKFIVR